MKKLLFLIPVGLLAAVVLSVVNPFGPREDLGWPRDMAGAPHASAPNLVANGDFSDGRLAGWNQRKQVLVQPNHIPDGEAVPGSGRNGTGAFHFGPANGKRSNVAAVYSLPDVRHADLYFDGYVRLACGSGRAWAGVEFTIEDAKGDEIFSYLAWKGAGGAAAPARARGLVEEMADAGDGWWRVPTRVTRAIRDRGIRLSGEPFSMTVRLWLDLEDAEAQAWFDDIQVKDNRFGK